jgi:photosystem II stability/assembly factor-like uncharacterized protein
MNKITILTFACVLLLSFFFSLNLIESEEIISEIKEEEKTSGALEALNFWTRARAYPNDDIPPDAFYNAYSYSKTNLLKENTPLAYNFEQLGPHNIGGRTLDVQFNPQNTNTIFAGAASGGLWRSYSGGVGASAWHQMATGFPLLGVSSLAIVPNDSNTIYIGTGEVYNYQNSIGGLTIRTTRGSYGIGILKTTNYGITWNKVLDWSYNSQRAVQKVRIDPNNFNVIWAATTEGTFKSTNAGQTWSQVHNVLMATDVIINPSNSSIVYEACGNFASTGHGIYRTTNSGSTWTQLTSGLPASYGGKALLEIYQANPQIIFASIGNGSSTGSGTWLCKSTNGGENWSIINTTDYATYQGWYSHWVGVNPTNQNLVLTGGIDVYKSTNGGTTLTKKTDWSLWYFGITPPGGPEGPPNYVHADQHSITYHPNNPNIIYLGTDGGVFRTTDGGETFAGCNGGYQSTQFYSQFSSSFTSSNIGIGGMQDNATAIYLGTNAWKRVIGGDGCATGINPTNENIMYGTYQYLGLQRTTNQGNNWSGIQPPNSTGAGFYAPFVVCRSNPAVLYAGSNYVHKSTNQGSTWTLMNGGQALDGNPLLAMTASNYSTDTVYATTSPISSRGRVFVTTNGGTSWTNITGSLPDRYLTDIAIAKNNASIVYVTVAGYGTSHLFKSTNGGQNWIDIGLTLPDAPGFCVIVDPLNQNNIFYGNDITAYASTDAGSSWFEYSNGLPDAVYVYDMNILATNHKIRIATHGNGVYEAEIDLVIPVELISFTGQSENNKIILNWSTATELNNKGFEVERRASLNPSNQSLPDRASTEGETFGEWETAGFVEGSGTTTEFRHYSFVDENIQPGIYSYRLKQLDFDGNYNYSKSIEVNLIYAGSFVLYQNYPNPFNPSTKIKFTIPNTPLSFGEGLGVRLVVYDVLGNEIATLINEEKQPGVYEVEFNVSQVSRTEIASGIYFYQLKARGPETSSGQGFIETKKMVLLK